MRVEEAGALVCRIVLGRDSHDRVEQSADREQSPETPWSHSDSTVSFSEASVASPAQPPPREQLKGSIDPGLAKRVAPIHKKWSIQKFADELGTSPLLITGCLRCGLAAPMLCTHIRDWIPKAPREVLAKIPSEVVDVLNECFFTSEGQDGFDALDPATREHFTYLQKSIGHNFISVLNDPTADIGSSSSGGTGSWTSWLTGSSATASTVGSTSAGSSRMQGHGSGGAGQVTDPMFLRYFAQLEEVDCCKGLGPMPKVRMHRHAHKPMAAHGPTVSRRLVRHNFNHDLSIRACPPEFFQDGFMLSRLLGRIGVDNDVRFVAAMEEQLHEHFTKIESALIAMVQERSPHFFHALTGFDSLQCDVREAIKELHDGRQALASINKEVVQGFIHTEEVHRRRQTASDFVSLLKSVQSLQEVRKSVQGMLHSRCYLEAARIVNEALLACRGGAMKHLTVVNTLEEQLLEARQTIKLVTADDLARTLTKIPTKPLTVEEREEIMGDAHMDTLGGMIAAAEELGVASNVKVDFLFALKRILEAVVKETLTRECPAIFGDEAKAKRSAEQGGQQPDRPPPPTSRPNTSSPRCDFNFAGDVMLVDKATVFSRTVNAVMTDLGKFFVAALSHVEHLSSLLPGIDTDAKAQMASGLQDIVAFLLNQWPHLHRLATVDMFRKIFAAVDENETLLNAKLTALRGTLQSHVRGFFKKHHEKTLDRVLQVVTGDKWQPVKKIEKEYYYDCDVLIGISTTEAGKVYDIIASDSDVTKNDDDNRDPRTMMFVRDVDDDGSPLAGLNRGFVVSVSALESIKAMASYVTLLSAFPFLGNDVTMKLHDIVKLYDGQCAGLVLGGGAAEQSLSEPVGLPHLALGSQCLECLAEVTAAVRLHLERVLRGSNAVKFLPYLTRVEKELLEHRDEYYLRIISLVQDRIKGIPDVEATEWCVVAPSKKGETKRRGSAYVMTLLKEAVKLQRALKAFVGRDAQTLMILPLVGWYCQKLRSKVLAVLQVSETTPVPSSGSGGSTLTPQQAMWDDVSLLKLNTHKLFQVSLVHASSAKTLSIAGEIIARLKSELNGREDRQSDPTEARVAYLASVDNDDALYAMFFPSKIIQ